MAQKDIVKKIKNYSSLTGKLNLLEIDLYISSLKGFENFFICLFLRKQKNSEKGARVSSNTFPSWD